MFVCLSVCEGNPSWGLAKESLFGDVSTGVEGCQHYGEDIRRQKLGNKEEGFITAYQWEPVCLSSDFILHLLCFGIMMLYLDNNKETRILLPIKPT